MSICLAKLEIAIATAKLTELLQYNHQQVPYNAEPSFGPGPELYNACMRN